MKKYQVNLSYKITDLDPNVPFYVTTAWIGKYQGDNVTTIDAEYADGNMDFTDWCVFEGSKEECQKFIDEEQWKRK